jgi:hypothetical protein
VPSQKLCGFYLSAGVIWMEFPEKSNENPNRKGEKYVLFSS